MKAKDLMVPVQDLLTPTDTLSIAVKLLKTARRSEQRVGAKGLPVIDKDGRLVGMLSMQDVLKATFPFYMRMMDLGDFSWDGMVEDIARKAAHKPVGEVMSSVVITVREDASLMECIDHMIKHNIKRLPVLDTTGKVVGMLYERDVFFAVTKAMLEEKGVE